MWYSAPLALTLATFSPLSFVSAQWFTAPALNSPITVEPAAEQALVAAVPGSGPVAALFGFQTEAPSRETLRPVSSVFSSLQDQLILYWQRSARTHLSDYWCWINNTVCQQFFVDQYSGGNEDTKARIGFAVFVINWIAGTVWRLTTRRASIAAMRTRTIAPPSVLHPQRSTRL
jgi:hypothetical protein